MSSIRGGPPMLKISDFSKLSRISIRMLRYYDEKGILKPVFIESNNYRYYEPEQLQIANQINYLRYLGFSSEKIKMILETFKNKSEVKRYLQLQLVDLTADKNEMDDKIKNLKMTIAKMDEEEILMNYKVETKVIEFKNMMCKRGIIPCYEREDLLWSGMGNEVKELEMDIKYPTNQISLAVFYDEGFKEKDPDVEIMVAVEGKYEDIDNIKFKSFGPMKVVSITYTGAYDHIAEMSTEIAKWISENNCEIVGPTFTIYHVGYAHNVSPDKFVTEVCYPIG